MQYFYAYIHMLCGKPLGIVANVLDGDIFTKQV